MSTRVQFGRIPYAMIDSGALRTTKPADLAVYVVICGHCNGTAWMARVSTERIAELTGFDVRSVYRALLRLQTQGLIEIVSGGGRGRSNLYQITTNPDTGVSVSKAKPCRGCQGLEPETLTRRALNPDTGVRPTERTETEAALPDGAFVFPTEGKGTWTLPETKRSEYAETYPHLDIDHELAKARQWLRDNPSRRKTARGMAKFIGGWLSRADGASAKNGQRERSGWTAEALEAITPHAEPPDDLLTNPDYGPPVEIPGHD